MADLLDGIAERFAEYRRFMVGDVGLYTRLGQLPVKLLNGVLRVTLRNRDSVAADRLYEWLGVVSDPGLRAAGGGQPILVRFELAVECGHAEGPHRPWCRDVPAQGRRVQGLGRPAPVRGSPAEHTGGGAWRWRSPPKRAKAASFYLQETP